MAPAPWGSQGLSLERVCAVGNFRSRGRERNSSGEESAIWRPGLHLQLSSPLQLELGPHGRFADLGLVPQGWVTLNVRRRPGARWPEMRVLGQPHPLTPGSLG